MENLRAAGTIAGESSRAYDEIVTISMVQLGPFPSLLLLSLLLAFKTTGGLCCSPSDPRCPFVCAQVTCRAIGIGAYLVRLGQRIIQVENSHIILTGVTALNKVPSSGCMSSMALSFPPLPVWAPSLSHGTSEVEIQPQLRGDLPVQRCGLTNRAREQLVCQQSPVCFPWELCLGAGTGGLHIQQPAGRSADHA